jgi:crotonobetainyl-CoA:carnitine CoA-transferase CaiB-like acyl-CoA transferase
MCRALERPEWIDDPRFATPAARVINAAVRLDLTADVLKSRTSAEWLKRLEAEQVPCAPVLTREQVIRDAQVAANQLIVESEHPQAGRMRQPRPAARFSATPAEIRRQAPGLGEHTDEVLASIGVAGGELAALRAEGVIA